MDSCSHRQLTSPKHGISFLFVPDDMYGNYSIFFISLPTLNVFSPDSKTEKKGREGKGREGKGREGTGRERKGREKGIGKQKWKRLVWGKREGGIGKEKVMGIGKA